MSISKYVSNVKVIDHNIEVIYNYLSDFGNLAAYFNQDILDVLSAKIPHFEIRDFVSDADSCRFSIGGMGNAEIRVVERSPFNTLKLEGQGSFPVSVKFWIQLLPVEENKTKMRLTLHADMGMVLKMAVGSKLEKGIDQLADALSLLPYHG